MRQEEDLEDHRGNAQINLTTLSIDTDRTVANSGDGSVVLDSVCCSLVSTDSDAGREEVAGVGIGLGRRRSDSGYQLRF